MGANTRFDSINPFLSTKRIFHSNFHSWRTLNLVTIPLDVLLVPRIGDIFKKMESGIARETNTMPQWAGSCWYYFRFLDNKNDQEAFSKQADADWMPVDLYVGGSEHAVLHLLYARFWHQVLVRPWDTHNIRAIPKVGASRNDSWK